MKGKDHVEQQHTEILITNRSIYHPPWRDRLPDGSLGPWYGPRSVSEYLRERREHRQRSGKPRSKTIRLDAEAMNHFISQHGHEVPAREMEVYVAIYVDARSVPAAAQRLGIKRDTIKGLLGRLRRRLLKDVTK